MAGSNFGNAFALGGVVLAMFVLPYLIVAGRKRFGHTSEIIPAYGPHLMFITTVRGVPMLKDGVPSAGSTLVAFVQVVVVWGIAASISEWVRYRSTRARDI